MRNSFFWRDNFSSMTKWADKSVPMHKLKWVEVYGVPMHCWCKGFFSMVGNDLGETIWVDEAIKDRGRMDVGRILVLGQFESLASRKVLVKVGDKMVQIGLSEAPEPVSTTWIVKHLRLKPEFKFSKQDGD
jgi:hypothetical protein